jgi:hypothetical protein
MLAGTEWDDRMKFHLVFVRKHKPKGKKTNIYVIYKEGDVLGGRERLGEIRWYGAFRQYCVIHDNGTVWSWGCNQLVNNFLKKVNDRYRKKLRRKKNAI